MGRAERKGRNRVRKVKKKAELQLVLPNSAIDILGALALELFGQKKYEEMFDKMASKNLRMDKQRNKNAYVR
jgi:hypothetical protein